MIVSIVSFCTINETGKGQFKKKRILSDDFINIMRTSTNRIRIRGGFPVGTEARKVVTIDPTGFCKYKILEWDLVVKKDHLFQNLHAIFKKYKYIHINISLLSNDKFGTYKKILSLGYIK